MRICPTAWSGRLPTPSFQHLLMQIVNTITVLALVVLSFALIVAIPVLYVSREDSGDSNRLILISGGACGWPSFCSTGA